jgi:hypothetical protein
MQNANNIWMEVASVEDTVIICTLSPFQKVSRRSYSLK